MNYAPLALFVYKRPDHVRAAIQSLMQCPEFLESKIFVYCDGPRTKKDTAAVKAARDVAKGLLGERACYIESEFNLGLANSVINGVSDLCERYGKVIVVEDDLIVASSFLTFLNTALNRYEYENKVMQISGHMFNVPVTTSGEAIMLPFTTSWGWATWRRAWSDFDMNMVGLDKVLADKNMRYEFDLKGAYPYSKMLIQQSLGRVDSWAIRWYLSVFNKGGLVLFPSQSLVKHDGYGEVATHAKTRDWDELTELCSVPITRFPDEPLVNLKVLQLVAAHIRIKNSLLRKVLRGLRLA